MKTITSVPGLPPTSTIQDPAARAFCMASAQAIEELRRRKHDAERASVDVRAIEESLRLLQSEVMETRAVAISNTGASGGTAGADDTGLLEHVRSGDPHPQYLLRSEYSLKAQISTPVPNAGKTWASTDSTNTNLVITDTAPGVFANTRSTQVLQFDFVSNGYFSGNATNGAGHFAIVLRCNTDLISTSVHGHGLILGSGNLTPTLPGGGGPRWQPSSQIETWFNGTGHGNYLIPETDGYPDRLLQESVTYRCIVTSSEDADGEWYIRYRLYRYHPDPLLANRGVFELERDTGDVLDTNPRKDLFGTGVAIGHVFEDPAAPAWSFQVKDMLVYWTVSQHPVTQVPTLTSGYGNRLRVDTSNLDFTKRFAIQDAPDLETTVTAIPGANATQSSFLATNNPDLSGAFQFMAMGMFGVDGKLYTYGVGAGHPALQLAVGDDVLMGMDNTGILATRDFFVDGKLATQLGTRYGEMLMVGNDVVIRSGNSDGAPGPVQFQVGTNTIMGMDSTGVEVVGELRATAHTVVGGTRSGLLQMLGNDVVIQSTNSSGSAGPIRLQVGAGTVFGVDSTGGQINGDLVVTGTVSGTFSSSSWTVAGGIFSSDAGSTFINSTSLPVQLRVGGTTIVGMDNSAIGLNRNTSVTGNLSVSGTISGTFSSSSWTVAGGTFSSDAGSTFINSTSLPVQLRVGGTTIIGMDGSAIGLNRSTAVSGSLSATSTISTSGNMSASGQVSAGTLYVSGASSSIGSFSGWSMSFSGTKWRTGSFNTDTKPTTVSACGDEIVGIKRIIAAMHDDLRNRRVLY